MSDRCHSTCEKDMHAIVKTFLPAPPSPLLPGSGERRASCWIGENLWCMHGCGVVVSTP